MDDLMLERLLERSAASTAYPPTPPLRGRVLASMAAPASPHASQRPAFVLAALAVVALAVAATLVLPSSRSAIAEIFGIEGSKIERLPTPAGGVVPTPLPTPEEIRAFAHPSTIADAAGAMGFTPALVPGESSPEAFIARYASDAVVILRYRSFDLWEMRARDIFFGKGLPEGVVVLDTAVNGNQARWIEGGHTSPASSTRTASSPAQNGRWRATR